MGCLFLLESKNRGIFLIAKSKPFVYYQVLKFLILTLLFFGLETDKWYPDYKILTTIKPPVISIPEEKY